MASPNRCSDCYLLVLLVFFGTLLGTDGQCWTRNGFSFSRPLRLQASAYLSDDIFSPGFPGDYNDSIQCSWSITTGDPSYVVRLHVIFIDLEETTGVDECHDYISVFDSSFKWGSLITFCRNDVYEIYSTGRDMFIEFISDESINAMGFHLSYKAVQRTSTVWTTSNTVTTSFHTEESGTPINTRALIGGMIGGAMVFFILCYLCRYYVRSKCSPHMAGTTYIPASRTSTTRPTMSQFTGFPTTYQNDNAVFMVTSPVSGNVQTSFSGVTNMAYSSAGDAPPPYFSVQYSSATSPYPGGVPPSVPHHSVPPPSYTEAMMVSHPPATPTTKAAAE